MEQLDVRFRKLWHDLGLAGEPTEVWRWLNDRYSSPDRHYHTLNHISYGLDVVNEIFDPITENDLGYGRNILSFAFFFHDSMPDERRSADAAMMVLELARKKFMGRAVERFILLTAHKNEPVSYLDKVIVDADLAILGSDREKFDEYEIGVRREYAQVSDRVFASERVKILNSFLTRKSIYYTLYCQRELEGKARANLKYSIDKLLELLKL